MLVLRRVKGLLILVQDLAANVDRGLVAASKALLPVDGLFTAKDRERSVRRAEKTITDEKGVANFYDKTIAIFCTPLAISVDTCSTPERFDCRLDGSASMDPVS